MIPHVEFDPAIYVADRASWWRWMRALGPLVRIDSTGNRCYFYVTRSADIQAVLHNNTAFSTGGEQRTLRAHDRKIPLVPLTADPDHHKRLSKTLRPLFSPSGLAPLRTILQSDAADLLDTIHPRGECDAVTEIGHYWPALAAMRLCGMPKEDATRLVAWWNALGTIPGHDHTPTLLEYVDGAVALAIRRPMPGLIAELLDHAGDLTDDEITAVCAGMCIFAIDLVNAALTKMLHTLACQPEARRYLLDNPGQLDAYIHEFMRLDPPAPTIARIVTEPVTVAGHTLQPGVHVKLCLAAANLEDHEGIGLNDDGSIRRQRSHSFGLGIHRCLANHLATLQLSVLMTEWLRRIPHFDVPHDFTPEYTWEDGEGPSDRLKTLPLRWIA